MRRGIRADALAVRAQHCFEKRNRRALAIGAADRDDDRRRPRCAEPLPDRANAIQAKLDRARMDALLVVEPVGESVVCIGMRKKTTKQTHSSSSAGSGFSPHQYPARLHRQLPAPVLDQHEADRHATQMREVRNAGLRAGDAEEKLDRAVADHEQPCRHRDRREQQEDARVRIHHAVREQEAENAARSAERRIVAAGDSRP